MVKTPMLMVVMKYPTDSDLLKSEPKLDVPLVCVKNVPHNVLLVLDLLIPVPSVLTEEKTSQLVNAQMVNTKMMLITVKIVLQNVKLVTNSTNVTFVPKTLTELIQKIAHVTMDFMILVSLNVNLVILNVLLVLIMTNVLIVPSTEKIHPIVPVSTDTTIPTIGFVTLVPSNVTVVSPLPPIVLLVQPTPTDTKPQLVTVVTDTMKLKNKPVQNVTVPVILVKLLAVTV